MKQTTVYDKFPECCKRCMFKENTVYEWGCAYDGYVKVKVYSCRKNLFLPTKKQQCKKQKLTKKYRFIKFLKEENIYEEYRENFKLFSRNPNTIKTSIGYVSGYFLYGQTKQGDFFWRSINSKWLEILLKEYNV